eukprot:CAMPEP_0181308274 /NCGR_PEP_ID=MMETSP1101-20121128/11368_1 /TAXON_ID=46948 /ORGANISM="Rhodomonas abbreviata, Strain Caron Lab Isolate" /LENGTH=335 /DNA_ID=CAMNT_0023414631 /DNA_START=91 /DNA_END=1095 /DNA_ORIENTATION=-
MCTLPLHQTEDQLPLSRDEQSGLRLEYDESRELFDILTADDDALHDTGNIREEERTAEVPEVQLQGIATSAAVMLDEEAAEDPESLVFGGGSPCSSQVSDVSGVPCASYEGMDDVQKADEKKRRNREAARQSRAKKKRLMQDIEETQTTLEREKSDLRKENDSLRAMNQALERQLAFFQGMFRSTFTGGAFSMIPDTAQDASWHVGGTSASALHATAAAPLGDCKSSSGGSRGPNVAMGIVFLSVLAVGRFTELDAVLPGIELSRHPMGRMLLSLNPDPEASTGGALGIKSIGNMAWRVAFSRACAWASILSILAWVLFRGAQMVLARRQGWAMW